MKLDYKEHKEKPRTDTPDLTSTAKIEESIANDRPKVVERQRKSVTESIPQEEPPLKEEADEVRHDVILITTDSFSDLNIEGKDGDVMKAKDFLLNPKVSKQVFVNVDDADFDAELFFRLRDLHGFGVKVLEQVESPKINKEGLAQIKADEL